MKIQIDTTAKTIKMESAAKFSELFEVLEKLLPNDQWKEYTLEANTIIYNWNNPIYIPWRPWGYYGSGTYVSTEAGSFVGLGSTTGTLQLSEGINNVEIN